MCVDAAGFAVARARLSCTPSPFVVSLSVGVARSRLASSNIPSASDQCTRGRITAPVMGSFTAGAAPGSPGGAGSAGTVIVVWTEERWRSHTPPRLERRRAAHRRRRGRGHKPGCWGLHTPRRLERRGAAHQLAGRVRAAPWVRTALVDQHRRCGFLVKCLRVAIGCGERKKDLQVGYNLARLPWALVPPPF